MKKTEMSWLSAKVKPTKDQPICMHLIEKETDCRAVFLGFHDGKRFIDFRGEIVKPDHYFYLPPPPNLIEAKEVKKPIVKKPPVKIIAKKNVRRV